MQTSTTHYVDAATKVHGYILEVGEEKRRTLYLQIGDLTDRATFIINAPEFLDKLSNEADRLCREYVEGAPPLVIGGTSPISVGPGVFHDGPDRA